MDVEGDVAAANRHPPARRNERRITWIAGALLGAVVLLQLRRYAGIDHDATLYLGQALFRIWPEVYSTDLFFAYGSQGSYTLFPWLVAHAFHLADPPTVFLWGALVGLAVFASAAWFCLGAFLSGAWRYVAWLATLCLPSMYGRTLIFSYFEPFLTARPFAEAFCLLALGFLARERWALALVVLLAAMLLHPLQGTAALLVAWPWLVLRDRRWLNMAWGLLPLFGLAALGAEPFAGMLRQFDSAWLAELTQISGQLFLFGWPATDYMVAMFDALVLLCAWRSRRDTFGIWCGASVLGLGLGMSVSLVTVDMLQLQLPTALQLWRVHWVAHWMATAAIGVLLWRDLQGSNIPRALCLVLAALLVWGGHGWIWLPFALFWAVWPMAEPRLRARALVLLGWLFAIGILGLFAHHVAMELLSFRQAQYRLELYAFDRRILFFPPIALGLPLAAAYAWCRLEAGRQAVFAVIALPPLLVLGLMRWDSRPPQRLAIEREAFREDLFGRPLPPNAQVYWDAASLVGPWLVLGRADYYDPQQLSGAVFNRETIVEARRRLERVGPLLQESLNCRQMAGAAGESCLISDLSMETACGPGPVRRPDYIVLPFRQPQKSVAKWTMLDPFTGDTAVTYWLYSCASIANANGPPTP